MNTAEVTSKLVEILKKITKRDEIELDMSLMDDMELESLDIFNVLAEAETEFKIRIPERLLKDVDTVEDLRDMIMGLLG